jgi:hypothetical protein
VWKCVAVVFESRVVSELLRKICRGIKDLNPKKNWSYMRGWSCEKGWSYMPVYAVFTFT